MLHAITFEYTYRHTIFCVMTITSHSITTRQEFCLAVWNFLNKTKSDKSSQEQTYVEEAIPMCQPTQNLELNIIFYIFPLS